jgi:Ca2+/Na+ antiporter
LVGAVVLVIGVVLCVMSFQHDRDAAGNPALGLLGNVLFLSGVFWMVGYPGSVLSDIIYALQLVLIFGGFGLILIWVFVNAWRKRAAKEALGTDHDRAS